jgi:hypothetical protein
MLQFQIRGEDAKVLQLLHLAHNLQVPFRQEVRKDSSMNPLLLAFEL